MELDFDEIVGVSVCVFLLSANGPRIQIPILLCVPPPGRTLNDKYIDQYENIRKTDFGRTSQVDRENRNPRRFPGTHFGPNIDGTNLPPPLSGRDDNISIRPKTVGAAGEKSTVPHELRDREEARGRGDGPSAENAPFAVRREHHHRPAFRTRHRRTVEHRVRERTRRKVRLARGDLFFGVNDDDAYFSGSLPPQF